MEIFEYFGWKDGPHLTEPPLRVPHLRREADKVGNFRGSENPNTLPIPPTTDRGTITHLSRGKAAPKMGHPISNSINVRNK
jgi:hypothetical protein